MGIKTLIADVTAQTSDIAACAITTAKLGNSSVTTAKLGNCSVTTAKVAMGTGKWLATTFTAMTAAGTACFSYTFTSAATVLDCILQITAAASADLNVTVKDTAGSTLMDTVTMTAAGTFRSINVTALNSNMTNVIEVSAGGSVEGALTASLTVSTAGKIFLNVISTPS